MSKRLDIAEAELRELYLVQKLSTYQIAARYGCAATTIYSRLRAFRIAARSTSLAMRVRYSTSSEPEATPIEFQGDEKERAYLIGFRTGDLTAVMSTGRHGVAINGSSTQPEQVELCRRLFERYTTIQRTTSVNKRNGLRQVNMRGYLNISFAFLIEKLHYVPAWILSDNENFVAFFAGLVDAEGSFYIGKGTTQDRTPRAGFSIGMNDGNLLGQCRGKLESLDVRCTALRLGRRAGHVDKYGTTSRGDYWRFEVRAKASLGRLAELVGPLLRHSKRQADLQRVVENINWRNSETFRAEARACWRKSRHI